METNEEKDVNVTFPEQYVKELAGKDATFKVKVNGIKEKVLPELNDEFVSELDEFGDDIKTVSENLGHATVAFTLDVYGHVTEIMRKDSADRMQAYIESL